MKKKGKNLKLLSLELYLYARTAGKMNSSTIKLYGVPYQYMSSSSLDVITTTISDPGITIIRCPKKPMA